MNFSVVRGADTPWGGAFAESLAGNKRHLILLGKDEAALETLVREIVKRHRVLVHYMIADDSDTAGIVAVCEKINDRFEVDLLLNYTETGFQRRFEDYDIQSLDRKLKTNHTSGILYLHQLLPNLLLHAQARVINLWRYSQPLPDWEQALMAFNMRFTEHLNYELGESGLRIDSFSLPKFTNAESVDRVEEILFVEEKFMSFRVK